MKSLGFFVSLFFVLTLSILGSGCTQEASKNDELNNRIVEFENQVKTLQERLNDRTLKARIASSLIFKSPLEQFFQSPEFWENTYDSSQADCSKRCINDLQTARAQCEQIADDNQRLQCFNDAAQRAASCHTQCAR